MDPSVLVATPITQLQRHQNLHQFHAQPTQDFDTPPHRRNVTFKSNVLTKNKHVFSNLSMDDINHGIEMLEKCFRPVFPGRHTCLKAPGFTSFVHNKHSVRIGICYRELQVLMASRAKAMVLRDCIVRIRRFEAFVRHLKINVHEEYSILQHLQQHGQPASVKFETKLEYLEGFCDDLRVYLNYWTSIQHKVHSEKSLYPFFSELISELQTVKDKLLRLQESAIWWLYDLIRIGLSVFAYYKGDELHQDFLWSITRGIEEYNAILKQVMGKDTSLQKDSDAMHFSSSVFNAFNAPGLIKSITMQNLLGFVASERSKLVAFRTITSFCENKDLSGMLMQPPKTFNWQTCITTGEMSYASQELTSGVKLKSDLKAKLLSASDLQCLNLSKAASPLLKLEAEEEDFMSQLLSIASFSTAFLHPKFQNSQKRVSRGQLHTRRHSAKENSQSYKNQRLSRRKSVSWEDSESFTTKKQLCSWYMDQLWNNFTTELHSVLTLVRIRIEEHDHLHLGHVFQCGIAQLIIIQDMLEALCMEECLPHSAASSLQSLSYKLFSSVAMAASDIKLCDTLGSALSDKCLPATLQPEQEGSRTCSLLQASILPLISVLMASQTIYMFNRMGKVPTEKSDSLHIIPALQLVSAIDVGTYWCWTRAEKYLASWSVAEFLLVTQCDHQIIRGLCGKVVHLTDIMCRGTNQSYSNKYQLSTSSVQLNQILSNLQDISKLTSQLFSEDCGKMCSEYWQKTMPIGKFWRRKTTNVLPTEPNQYAKASTVTIIQPIIEAISRLQPEVQVSIVTVFLSTMFETWMEHILKQKSKFSIHGACQLEVDLYYVQHWFRSKSDILCQQAMQKILSLNAFLQFESAIQLLKQQPGRNDGLSNTLTGSVDEINSEYSESTAKSEACKKSLGSSSDSVPLGAEAVEDSMLFVPNRQEWLNLRVHGQSKKWVLPFTCMKAGQEN
ncbi:uncharacterized protein LOC117111028 [Anneissia japonica]|uniref:uncharacterized protein LOC117111028 n=1 Tax=Anneissia japonica TaxID=1529436 RepID=UPI001425A6E8|nr:uncharacterized protein LOC117111028 [Anneissia japonica]